MPEPIQLTIHRKALSEPLQMVAGVLEKKQTLPILSHVLINIEHQKLSITATDTEVELISQIPLPHYLTTAKVTMPGRKLVDICRALPEDANISIEQTDDKIVVTSGRSRFVLAMLCASEFPNMEPQKADLSFQIPQKDLLRVLEQTAFAIAHQDVRYYLTGLLLEVKDSKLNAVSTDAHRLAFRKIPLSIPKDQAIQVIVPRKGIIELMRLLNEAGNYIEVHLGSHYIEVLSEHFHFTSKLIDARFPDYHRVIPCDGDKSFVMDCKILKQALNRVAILSHDKFKGVKLKLSSHTLHLSTHNPEHEIAEEELMIDYPHPPMEIALNLVYLQDILNTVQSSTIRLTLSDPNSSILIEEEDTDDTLFVIMPMRL